ncbi:hypothetical protein PHYBLDRAFT_140535 [Phycomyces blakesleeanus NRRL 1555(-)]|uniref:Uncharacterized protein n=1 Tax=Phycomyces blakesleeanus (strain ATCC 8743b / DSM 1359 / FGSC 10004 / NBRC 33097 / NRRL 1555) TaxID=763407 RepID=A0A167K1J4_PHYB8|nr:hypothetical protein PHYBLDRAFT_152010 [Phycomyces blakesleeanus NRRL 1555(-)]XP_018296499.1 hypothetical protein PHYBLDRAFT_140535 [Phycomyces blakesleeanus NRRL 1555(-)]OAD67068.1 hypothetical protein PHYBLDRAFT_152010 [Phycomyces blakesleeanus NRRL 1555(-)]OAD78459.1 hypothetical protein PHYBLDRAFT_140535 [Phycomyces blakesleeanus NRRL 1555(-)]|eukprot:XP_018285108.1 hypothetical protein PHYBLDRAFT_152010 [Phycomyces blakesleeanus NRRL 1555(-)]
MTYLKPQLSTHQLAINLPLNIPQAIYINVRTTKLAQILIDFAIQSRTENRLHSYPPTSDPVKSDPFLYLISYNNSYK